MKKENQYTGYDYKEATVSKKLESAWKDGYENFGWELEKSRPAVEKHLWGPLRVMAAPLALLPGRLFKDMVMDHESSDKMELKLKRNREIKNKNELNRLQVSFEKVLSDMEHMEATKTVGASAGAYIVGLIGTICMALAVFGYTNPNMIGHVGFAIPGFIGWAAAFAVYHIAKKSKEAAIKPIMEQKFDEMNDICVNAHELTVNE